MFYKSSFLAATIINVCLVCLDYKPVGIIMLALRRLSLLHNGEEIVMEEISCATPAQYGGIYVSDIYAIFSLLLHAGYEANSKSC